MSYTFSIREGNNVVPASRDTAGFTALKLVVDKGGNSSPIEITSGVTLSGGKINVNVPAGQLANYQGTEYKVVGTKDAQVYTLQFGRIYSADVSADKSASLVTLDGPVSVTPQPTGDLIRTVQSKVREDFPGTAVDTSFWDVTAGPGMTVAVTASELRIDSGTTANSVTTLRSKKSWSGAYRVMFMGAANMLSQRIANHTAELRVTNAAGTSYAGWALSGTVTTTGLVRAYNNGTTSGDQTQSGIPTTNGPLVLEIENFIDEVYYHSRAPESTNARATTNVKNRQTPDPNEEMFIEIRITNGATAPASSTRLSLDAILVQDISELTTEITGGRGGGGQSQAIPVTTVGGSTVSVGNSNLVVANSVAGAQLSVTNLTSGATYTQTAIDLTTVVGTYPTRIRPVVMHLAGQVHGQLRLEESTDGTTYRETWRSPIPSDGLYHSFDIPLHYRYYRLVFNNGATAQTGFFLGASTYRGDGATDIDKVLSFPLTTAAGQALGASATFTGPTIDLGGNHMWDKVRLFIQSDVAGGSGGTQIQHSNDGTTWRAVTAVTLAVATPQLIENGVMQRYVRVVSVNGATAAAGFFASLALVSL